MEQIILEKRDCWDSLGKDVVIIGLLQKEEAGPLLHSMQHHTRTPIPTPP